MRPKEASLTLLGVTRSKAKMYEYGVPEEEHIKLFRDPARLFTVAIAILGELAARINEKKPDEVYINELQKDLQFSARFFDTYMQARLDIEIEPYLIIIGAASYYLCNLPGSSLVLVNRIKSYLDLDGLGLERLLLWLLKGDFNIPLSNEEDSPYGKFILEIAASMSLYRNSGKGDEMLSKHTQNLRKYVYEVGTSRQLFLVDVVCALVKKRLSNSTWYCLPNYSNISLEKWSDVFQKKTFIGELWPAQHLLGEHGVYRGESAIVQMPTSAGKTKATEIIIRSAFLSGKTYMAVIVAPFRALCHEIRDGLATAFLGEDVAINELSDVMQADFDEQVGVERQQIIITTPEKLVYVIRQMPKLVEGIGLLIFDEGHQFDSGKRGVTYELLLTSLKTMAPLDAQTVLISAVISNANAINEWLNPRGKVVPGSNLVPTYRSVAFSSWLGSRGQLEFVNQDNPDSGEFFVPRIIEQYELMRKPRERKVRLFPERNDGKTISLHLGLKLVSNGGVAIFCGTKSTATGLCEKVVDIFDRKLPMDKPVTFSDEREIQKLHFLYASNLGVDVFATRSAELGVLSHHANIPHGIRIAVEHALKEGLGRFVICTSTLAQGVNLPIRYLIVSSVYQGRERIRVRDFHNLIGRAGRAGLYTEGSILFADPTIYDKKNVFEEKWRWRGAKQLLNPQNTEPCVSTLRSFFDPLKNDTGDRSIKMNPLVIMKLYINKDDDLFLLPNKILEKFPDKNYSIEGIRFQLDERINILSAIESFLMAHWDNNNLATNEDEITKLAKNTLAYHLASEAEKQSLVELFIKLAENIEKSVQEMEKRKVYGRTLYGVNELIALENWINKNIHTILACDNQDELLSVLWPAIYSFMNNSTLRKSNPKEIIVDFAKEWINGVPYYKLLEILEIAELKIGEGTKPRVPTIDNVVELCEGALAYEGALAIGAIAEFIALNFSDEPDIVIDILELQKRIKYGLPSRAITVYEMGFSDRVIAMEVSRLIVTRTRRIAFRSLKRKAEKIKEVLEKYPLYYTEKLKHLLRE